MHCHCKIVRKDRQTDRQTETYGQTDRRKVSRQKGGREVSRRKEEAHPVPGVG